MANPWHEVLSVAIHTPSPHNVQPWRVKVVSDTEAELYIDAARTLPKEDVTGSFILCAMGMFVEALNILVGRSGKQIECELLSEPGVIARTFTNAEEPMLVPFAKLRLGPLDRGPADGYDAAELFLKRRTSRLHLYNKLPSDDAIASLRQVAETWNQSFDMTTTAEQIERILDMNTSALFEDLNSAQYHDEIVEWFRYTEKQSEQLRDGLDARCMNTSPINYWIIANLPQVLLLPISRQILKAVYRRQTGLLPALGYISGAFWDPADAINSGRFLMQFWLETARLGLYIHPFGNLVTNKRAADLVQTELGVRGIWLIFKIGYSDEPPKSRRLPLERILISDTL